VQRLNVTVISCLLIHYELLWFPLKKFSKGAENINLLKWENILKE
jgi:hypothetical protein